MSVITFGGLSTGMDSNSIIQRLVELENQQANALKRRKSDAATKQKTIADLKTRLQTLKEKGATVDESSEIRAYTATSSDEAAVRVSASSTASAGTYDISVGRLARAETSRSDGFAADATSQFGSGTLGITVGSDDEITVAFDGATDSLSDFAARINDSDARVHAFVTFDGTSHRLVVTGEDSGATNAISFTETDVTGTGLGLAGPGAEVVDALDAQFTLNGMSMTSASNHLEQIIPGVSVDLRGVTAGQVSVAVERDPAASREKVQAFVDAYNEVVKLVGAQMTYSGVQRGSETLFGDFTLRNLQRELGGALASAYGGNGLSARSLGIELSSTGSLTIDATKFDAADSADIDEVLSGESGLASALRDLADKYATGSDSLLAGKESALKSEQSRYDDQIERINTRAEAVGERLRRQFSAMEAAISAMQSQAQYLASLFVR